MASFYTSADALVERDGKYLMIKEGKERCRGTWNVPGGAVEHGETPVEAVRRELYEETGLKAESVEGLIAVCTGNSTRDGYPVNVFVFKVEVGEGEPEPEFDEEVLDAQFKSPEEIRELELRNDIVLKALEAAERGEKISKESFSRYKHPYLDEEP
jgi:ADP-ribose pyrophosphatase YjhB (NUDIX family)